MQNGCRTEEMCLTLSFSLGMFLKSVLVNSTQLSYKKISRQPTPRPPSYASGFPTYQLITQWKNSSCQLIKLCGHWRQKSLIFVIFSHQLLWFGVGGERKWRTLFFFTRQFVPSSCSWRLPRYFLFPPPLPPLPWRWINPLWFIFYHPRSTDFEEKTESLWTG